MADKYLKDKYRLERKIAQGGMSSIYLCTNIELGNQWIAKHIDRQYSKVIYEEEILKKLNHISLPRIIDICREDTGIYIIESYVEGISLQKKLESFGSLSVEKVIDYTLQLCEVLIYLHNLKPKAIIHRDIKPSNIIITEYDKLVLIDFGISEELGASRICLRAGTNAYAAPEQLVIKEGSGTSADIYSLGIVLYHILTGQLPGGCCASGKEKTDVILEKLLEISSKCSRFFAEERYQKVEDIKRELQQLKDKCILIKEKNTIKRKAAMILIGLLSVINYGCLMIGLILFRG